MGSAGNRETHCLNQCRDPVVAPAGLVAPEKGAAPWPGTMPAPRASNVVIVPSSARKRPCATLIASAICPAITPDGLMFKTAVSKTLRGKAAVMRDTEKRY